MDSRQAKDLEEAELNIDGAYKLERTLDVMLGCILVYSIQPAIQMQELLQDFVGQKKMGIVNYNYCCNVILYDDILGGMGLVVDYIYIYFWMLDGGMVVHPSVQGNGIGTRALQLALKESDAARRPVLLTTNEARKL